MIGLAITTLFTLTAFAAVSVLIDSYIRGRNAYRELIERMTK